MRLAQVLEVRQQQTQRIDPRQILASEILSWTMAEVDAAIERELGENPALENVDGERNSAFSTRDHESAVDSPVMTTARLTLLTGDDSARTVDSLPAASQLGDGAPVDSIRDLTLTTYGGGAEDTDPLDFTAACPTLREHLRSQVGLIVDPTTNLTVVRYLIECLDERGYLTVESVDIAEQFRVTVVEVEEAIRSVQAMEPAGVGAQNLQECLILQVDFLEQVEAEPVHPIVRQILTKCWDELGSHREDRIAARLRVPAAQVREAIEFVRRALTPYPATAFRPELRGIKGSGASPDGCHSVRPDLTFHRSEAGFAVEMSRDYETMLTVAPLWQRLSERGERGADESMRRYIREHVDRAQTFVTGIKRRGSTLRRIAAALIDHQQGFLETGNRAYLRPLTRQALSEQLQLDESVISRAVADKWVQLPAGDVIPLDAFFGNANAVREALVNLVANENPSDPYSDDEIVDLLTEQGFPLARRTVAKYRSLERILPARLRRNRSAAPTRDNHLKMAA